MRYEIDSDNCVWIFPSEASEIASIKQPHWPSGAPWASRQEAENWAQALIAHSLDETQPMAGNDPSQPTIEPAIIDPLDKPIQITQRVLTDIISQAVNEAIRANK